MLTSPLAQAKLSKTRYNIPQITNDALFRVFPARLMLYAFLRVAHGPYFCNEHVCREAERAGSGGGVVKEVAPCIRPTYS